jgi:hypothetical protein
MRPPWYSGWGACGWGAAGETARFEQMEEILRFLRVFCPLIKAKRALNTII